MKEQKPQGLAVLGYSISNPQSEPSSSYLLQSTPEEIEDFKLKKKLLLNQKPEEALAYIIDPKSSRLEVDYSLRCLTAHLFNNQNKRLDKNDEKELVRLKALETKFEAFQEVLSFLTIHKPKIDMVIAICHTIGRFWHRFWKIIGGISILLGIFATVQQYHWWPNLFKP